jgi:hypothetical protein
MRFQLPKALGQVDFAGIKTHFFYYARRLDGVLRAFSSCEQSVRFMVGDEIVDKKRFAFGISCTSANNA